MRIKNYCKPEHAGMTLIKICMAFMFFSSALPAQTKENTLLSIYLQGPDYVEQEFRVYLSKDSIEYHRSQSSADVVRKGKLERRASADILRKAIPLMESLTIDSTKETGLFSSHFLSISLSINKQAKSVYIEDKYYYTFLEEIFKTINANVGDGFKIPVDAVSFTTGNKPVNKKGYNSFGIHWWHAYFENPKNRVIYHNANYGDTIKITARTEIKNRFEEKKGFLEKPKLDSLWFLTGQCAGYFKFDTRPMIKPVTYETFEVYRQTQAVGIYTTLLAFEAIEWHGPFKKLKYYINRNVLVNQLSE